MEWCPLYLKRPCPFLSSECSVPWKKSIGVYNYIYHPQEMDFFVWLSICFQKLMRGARILLCLVAQSCLTLCDPMHSSPPGSSVHEILQPRILEWVAMPSRGSSQSRDRTQVSHIAGRFFTVWATREAQGFYYYSLFRINARFQADNYPEVNLPSLNIFGEQRYTLESIPCEW